MNTVSEAEVYKVLDDVYPQYQDDLPPDNVRKIIARLLAKESPEAVTKSLETGGHKDDYLALIEFFTLLAALVISVIEIWKDRGEGEPETAESKRDSELIISLLDSRVRDDPNLNAVIEAVRRAHR